MNVNIFLICVFKLILNQGIQLHAIILLTRDWNLKINCMIYTCAVYHKQHNRFCVWCISFWTTGTIINCRWTSNLNDFAVASYLRTGIVAQARSKDVSTWTVNHFHTHWRWCIRRTIWSVTITELCATAKRYSIVIPPVYYFTAGCCTVADKFFSITDISLWCTVHWQAEYTCNCMKWEFDII